MPTADIAVALGKAVAPPAVGLLRGYGKRKYDQFIATYTNVFGSFLEATEHKCRSIKTLLNPDVAKDLREIYVETVFDAGDEETFSDASIVEKIKAETGGFVVTGLAGSGKSMFMRWAALTLIEQMLHHQRIPLFVEVRDLSYDDPNRPLEDRVFDHCACAGNRATVEQFKIGLKEGLFILMLDGVDEAPPDRLDQLLASLKLFHNTYRQCVIVASVRPGTQLPNISLFRVLPVKAMTLDQIRSVLEKAPYNAQRKAILIDSLENGLYETHHSFLSNPLLVTIMLVTFDDASRVPSNLTGFYSAAFDALFSRHDWSKGVFVRKHITGLEKFEFERIFTYFCYLSYFYSSYIFTKDHVAELIESAVKMANIDVSPEDYLRDCIVSVCLLQVDEPKIIFVHRSFQEYFTAKFVSRYSGPKLPKMIDWLSARSSTDNTFLMTVQLNREAVARAWAVSKCRDLISTWRDALAAGNPMKIFLDLGVTDVHFRLRDGQITGYAGEVGEGLDLVNAILTVGDDAPATARHYYLTGDVYSSKPFVDLTGPMKSFIHKFTRSNEIVEAPLTQWPRGADEMRHLAHLAEIQIGLLEQSLRRMESFLEAQDDFADMVELVHALEAGRE